MKNDRRTILGWAMYDWANSAYSTVIAGAILPAYFASQVVPEGGYRGQSGQTLWGFVTGGAAIVLFLVMPVLGAMADFSASKRRFLQVFAYGGALFTTVLFFATTGNVIFTLVFFTLAQFGFVGANVFYDGFLPDISTDDTIDRVSSKGFALGYVGGGLYLALSLALIQLSADGAMAARIAIGGTGLWWAGFSLFAFSRLRETGTATALPQRFHDTFRPLAYAQIGFGRTWETAKRLVGFKQLLLFVVAYMLYNDGVQTTINMSAVYASDTLQLDTSVIALTFLVVQFVAFAGALGFGWLASRLDVKRAIQINLVVWMAVAVAAFFLPTGDAVPFLATGVVIGVVLGGGQALSRSLYGSMIPEEASAEFYGFFSVFSKFSAIWGPLIFATVSAATGSGRNAILSIIGFFALGFLLFSAVDIDEARRSRERWSFAPDPADA